MIISNNKKHSSRTNKRAHAHTHAIKLFTQQTELHKIKEQIHSPVIFHLTKCYKSLSQCNKKILRKSWDEHKSLKNGPTQLRIAVHYLTLQMVRGGMGGWDLRCGQ